MLYICEKNICLLYFSSIPGNQIILMAIYPAKTNVFKRRLDGNELIMPPSTMPLSVLIVTHYLQDMEERLDSLLLVAPVQNLERVRPQVVVQLRVTFGKFRGSVQITEVGNIRVVVRQLVTHLFA